MSIELTPFSLNLLQGRSHEKMKWGSWQCHGFLDAFLRTGLTIIPIRALSAVAYWRARAESTFISTVILWALLQNISTSHRAEVQRHKAQWKHTDSFLCCFPRSHRLKGLAGTSTQSVTSLFPKLFGWAVDTTHSSRRTDRKPGSGAEAQAAVLFLSLCRNGHHWSHSPLISLKAFYEFAISVHLLSFCCQCWGSFCYLWVLLDFQNQPQELCAERLGREVSCIYMPARVCFTQCVFSFFQISSQTKPDLAALTRFPMNTLFQFWRSLWP